MKRILIIATALLMSGAAYAQTTQPNLDRQTPLPPQSPSTPTTDNPHTTAPAPAMPSSPGTAAPSGPMPGANSFTEAQAKSRIEGAGFTGITALAKDKDGIWRGKAMKNGTSHDVAVDYQGHVFPR